MRDIIQSLNDTVAAVETARANKAALKVNVEAARETLRKLELLADEIEQAGTSSGGKISQCRQSCMDGLDGENKLVMMEAIGDCRKEYRQIAVDIRTGVAVTRKALDALVRTDASLADVIRNM